ncbi:MAG: leucyl aminopeptidase family protein, partial [Pseudomonadota bacterium]
EPRHTALGWLLGTYRFTKYKSAPSPAARLVAPEGVDVAAVSRAYDAVRRVRDLVNTPAGDMLPDGLEACAREIAQAHGADINVTVGDALIAENFPMIHAVGRASDVAPRLIDLVWGDAKAPKVTLVGKGVCFDSGGLNIKGAGGMGLMKKDMGGAAHVLALGAMIMAAGLNVRLRVLVPAVENAISGNAFRPGDVLPTRKGLTVEIGNTDAEGRLVLSDALSLACEEKPDLLISLATLTGAARIAVGPELAPFYTDDNALAEAISREGAREADPVWRMPLWRPYDAMLSSSIADCNNISSNAFAGSVIAALFLNRFVEEGARWAHFDIYAWRPKAAPGRPVGGEAQAIRALFNVIADIAD